MYQLSRERLIVFINKNKKWFYLKTSKLKMGSDWQQTQNKPLFFSIQVAFTSTTTKYLHS